MSVCSMPRFTSTPRTACPAAAGFSPSRPTTCAGAQARKLNKDNNKTGPPLMVKGRRCSPLVKLVYTTGLKICRLLASRLSAPLVVQRRRLQGQLTPRGNPHAGPTQPRAGE